MGPSQFKTLPLPGQTPASSMFSHNDANWHASLFKGHNSTRDNLEFQWPLWGVLDRKEIIKLTLA